ncbi:MAG: tetratricopeptide repeat protein [Candidatus Thiodiazotropha sp. (ex Dulcina madagascariensis)]|nr:tetratricopeptide repeat protein [Candidatus Thiodiazotropha sp. (ex Dulcina madagascariensis)]MCU7925581.1 tetratricopeptide repeat protein [Candidatus Thiodiazotropha sp. (ex Dulcina madagascariensis)]
MAQISDAVPLTLQPESREAFQITPFLTQSAEYGEAIALLKNNDYSQVVDLGKQYIRDNPKDPKAHLILSLGWIGQGNHQALDRHLSELNRQLPKVGAIIKINLAKFYASKDNYVQALEYLPERPTDDLKSETLHLRASIYTHQGKNDNAIAIYRKILKQAPEDKQALMKIASLHLTKKNYAESQRYTRQLVAMAPDSVVALVLHGTNQLLLNQPSQAVTTFKKVMGLDADSPIGLLNLGCAYHSLRQYDSARDALEKLASTYPKTQEGHAGLALVYLAQGRYAPARLAAEKAIALNPRYPVPHLAMAAVSLSQKNSAGAARAYRNTGDLYSDFQRPDFDLAAYLQHHSVNDAISLATGIFFSEQGYTALALRALENEATDQSAPFLVITRSRMMWRLGQAKQAQTMLHKVSDAFPGLITPVIESADISYFSGNPEATLHGYKRALQLAPKLSKLHINLGNLYNALGEPDKAVEAYQAYLATNPPSPYVLNQLAATLMERQGMPDKALGFALDAQKIDPDSLSIKDTLGEIYFNLGRFQDSLQQYREVAAASPVVDPKTYYRMGLNYLALKDKDKAVTFIERALNTGKDFPLRSEAADRLTQLKSGD